MACATLFPVLYFFRPLFFLPPSFSFFFPLSTYRTISDHFLRSKSKVRRDVYRYPLPYLANSRCNFLALENVHSSLFSTVFLINIQFFVKLLALTPRLIFRIEIENLGLCRIFWLSCFDWLNHLLALISDLRIYISAWFHRLYLSRKKYFTFYKLPWKCAWLCVVRRVSLNFRKIQIWAFRYRRWAVKLLKSLSCVKTYELKISWHNFPRLLTTCLSCSSFAEFAHKPKGMLLQFLLYILDEFPNLSFNIIKENFLPLQL